MGMKFDQSQYFTRACENVGVFVHSLLHLTFIYITITMNNNGKESSFNLISVHMGVAFNSDLTAHLGAPPLW